MLSTAISHLNNIRNTTTFPPFSGVPHETDAVLAGRHWCFFGEIQSLDYYSRLVLHVHDRDGHKLPIAFYTEDKGTLVRGDCKAGYTVAVLYARRHNFRDGSWGVRIENIERAKIIPFSLGMLLDANELIFACDPARRCAGCGIFSSLGLYRCSWCKQVFYCGKKCQEISWKAGHMDLCPAVMQLAWFMEQDWAHLRRSLVF